MTITTVPVEIERDRYGRPLVIPPEGGKPVPYTRCTTFVGATEDMFKLGQWQQRHAVRGVALHEDLLAAVRATDPEDKADLNALVEEAKHRSGAGDSARMGTYLHQVTEAADRGQDPGQVELPWQSTGPVDPEAYRPDLAAYQEATRDFTAVHIEDFTVLDSFKIGGTPDRVVRYENDRYIADLKTGSIEYGVLKIAAQLSVYSRSLLYDPATGQRSEHGANRERGIIVHLPAGTGTCRLYWVDLNAGWEAVKLCRVVREKRSLSFKKLTELIDVAVTPVEPAPPSLSEQIAACRSYDEVRALWQANAAVWDEELTRLAKAHVASLGGTS